MKVTSFMKVAKGFVGKHSSELKTVGKLILFGVTVYSVAKDAPKAKEQIDALYLKKPENNKERFDNAVEIAKVVGKTSWKSIILVTLNGGLIVWNDIKTYKQLAASAAGYTLVRNQLEELEEKVASEVGENKLQKMKEEINANYISGRYPSEGEIIDTGKGNKLFFDKWNGRWFRSDYFFLRQMILDYRDLVQNNVYGKLNTFYEMINLPTTESGEMYGFVIGDCDMSNCIPALDLTEAIMKDDTHEAGCIMSFTDTPILLPDDAYRWC